MASHAPNRLRNYERIHETCLEHFRSRSFIDVDTLCFEAGDGVITIEGEIACRGGIVIRVSKDLQILDKSLDDPLVQTVLYKYNASVRGHRTFLRWDNCHVHAGHADEHHRHESDWRTEENMPGSPFWHGVDGWGTLTNFIEQVEEWYWRHREELPSPDGFAELRTHGASPP